MRLARGARVTARPGQLPRCEGAVHGGTYLGDRCAIGAATNPLMLVMEVIVTLRRRGALRLDGDLVHNRH